MDTELDNSQLVADWLTWHPKRYLLGLFTGGFASTVAMQVAMLLSTYSAREAHYPAKLFATLLYGFEATSLSATDTVVHSGYLLFGALGIFWALVFSHFVTTKNWFEQLAMGFVWAFLSWVFLWNLFGHSFRTIELSQVPSSGAFLVCLAYGLSLSSLSLLDKIFKTS